MPMQQRGFTLMELILVIVLLGIIAVTAAPRLGDLGAYPLRRATQDLVEALRYAQSQSMVHSGAANYQVSITSGGYSVTQGGAAITNPLTGAVGYGADPGEWSGITVSASGTVTFDSRGRPACSGGFSPCSAPTDVDVSLSLQKGSATETVVIEHFTGYVYAN